MKKKRSWTARAAVYSGRRDPVWPVSEADAVGLVKLWERLESFQGARPKAPPLGYRGCSLESDKGERWEAFGGVVWSGEAMRADPDGVFEKSVLKTAPVALGIRSLRSRLG